MLRLAVRVHRRQAELVLAELLELAPSGVEEVEISPCQLADPETLPARAVFIGPNLPIALIEDRLARLARLARG